MDKNRTCELCKDSFPSDNPRVRLCPNCEEIDTMHIKPILNDKPYGQATDADKAAIVERMKRDHTVKKGPFFNPKKPEAMGTVRNWRG